jgi:hypothetical protein
MSRYTEVNDHSVMQFVKPTQIVYILCKWIIDGDYIPTRKEIIFVNETVNTDMEDHLIRDIFLRLLSNKLFKDAALFAKLFCLVDEFLLECFMLYGDDNECCTFLSNIMM